MEGLLDDEAAGPPRPDGFQTLRLDEELVELEVEPRCRRDRGADALPSAGRGGDADDLEKLGIGSESTIISVRCCYIVGQVQLESLSCFGGLRREVCVEEE